jgi:hypothetical protein
MFTERGQKVAGASTIHRIIKQYFLEEKYINSLFRRKIGYY